MESLFLTHPRRVVFGGWALLLALCAPSGCAPRGTDSEVPPRERARRAPPHPDSAMGLLRRAQSAFLDDRCKEAVALAKRSLKKEPGMQQWVAGILGVCACRLGQRGWAQGIYMARRRRGRQLMYEACRSLGVTLRPAPRTRPFQYPLRTIRGRPRAQVWAAMARGDCALAVWLAMRAERRKPSQRNWEFAASCACAMERRAAEQGTHHLLKGSTRSLLGRICRSRRFVRRYPARGGAGASGGTPRPPNLRAVPPSPLSASVLYRKARTAWLSGQCKRAIRYARQANAKRSRSRHFSIIGACSCSLRRVALAQWAYARLRSRGHRSMLYHLCRRVGIDLPVVAHTGPRTSRLAPRRPARRAIPASRYSAKELYLKARRAWLAGQCNRAIRFAQQANAQKPHTRQWMIIGACACSRRLVALARQAYSRLGGGQRNMLQSICRIKGIVLP